MGVLNFEKLFRVTIIVRIAQFCFSPVRPIVEAPGNELRVSTAVLVQYIVVRVDDDACYSSMSIKFVGIRASLVFAAGVVVVVVEYYRSARSRI